MAILKYNMLDPRTYERMVKSSIIKPRVRLFILHPTETIKEEITDYITVGSGSLNINYNQGQRRSLNFELNNSDGRFTPSPFGLIWINTKFRLELGMELPNGDEVYTPAGVFVISNPNTAHIGAQRTVSFQCYDKFALLDGTLGGVLDSVYEVPENSSIPNAIQNILSFSGGNGLQIDTKPLLYDSTLETRTQTIISKSPNDSLGDIIIELANMVGADVWYDVEGNLRIQAGQQEAGYFSQSPLWHYTDHELEYISSDITYSFDLVKNRVIIVGCNVNGDYIYEGIAENHNAQSPTRIELIGTKNLYYEDANIYSEELANQRARYELNRLSILQQTVTMQSTYLIHLDVNKCIDITDETYGFYKEKFVIQSLNIPLGFDSTITLNCTNVNSLPYYPSV